MVYTRHVPHLVASLPPDAPHGPGVLTLTRCYDLLREAHDYLARAGMEAARRAALVEDAAAWGGLLKRVRVELPAGDRPLLVRGAEPSHSFAEVVNQCATMERLLDALAWAQTEESGLRAWTVAVCHPTTSSATDTAVDHDLVLKGPAGQEAWFEVSDVASVHDGNAKEEKDLRSLGLLGTGAARCDVIWPTARVFLVVSTEFATKLRRRRWKHITYREVFHGERTVVAEALPGAATTAPP